MPTWCLVLRRRNNMWSHHFYWGFNIGFEIYEGEVDGAPVDYFLINLGPLRIQKAEWA